MHDWKKNAPNVWLAIEHYSSRNPVILGEYRYRWIAELVCIIADLCSNEMHIYSVEKKK